MDEDHPMPAGMFLHDDGLSGDEPEPDPAFDRSKPRCPRGEDAMTTKLIGRSSEHG